VILAWSGWESRLLSGQQYYLGYGARCLSKPAEHRSRLPSTGWKINPAMVRRIGHRFNSPETSGIKFAARQNPALNYSRVEVRCTLRPRPDFGDCAARPPFCRPKLRRSTTRVWRAGQTGGSVCRIYNAAWRRPGNHRSHLYGAVVRLDYRRSWHHASRGSLRAVGYRLA
jgi:hypothetical protein